MCLQWEQAAPYHKRYLCGPKLLGELSGAAKKHVVGKRPDWVSFAGGVEHLMNHLRERLGRPQIPELSDYLNKYFRQSRRRRFETMNDYITRKCELYSRARQALMRVQPNPQSRQSHWIVGSHRDGGPQDLHSTQLGTGVRTRAAPEKNRGHHGQQVVNQRKIFKTLRMVKKVAMGILGPRIAPPTVTMNNGMITVENCYQNSYRAGIC